MKTIFKVFITFLISTTAIQAQSYPELVKVTGGSFTIGDAYNLGEDDEQSTHQVTLTDYHIGKTEVTVAQYRSYCSATGVIMPEEPSWGWNSTEPIVNVSWHDAIDYCDWLSEKLNRNITLPTEAQWEYAARGGNIGSVYIKYSGDNKRLDEYNVNVWEWCRDWYDNNYYANSSKYTKRALYRVLHGGDYNREAANWRYTNTDYELPDNSDSDYGFRVVSF